MRFVPRFPIRRWIAVTTILLTATFSAAAAPTHRSAISQAAHSPQMHGQQWANKAVVVHFMDRLLNEKDLSVIDAYVRHDYIQHDPTVADGREAFREAMRSLHSSYPDMRYEVMRVIAEADLVVVHGLLVLQPDVMEYAIVDIVRFQDGKLAEHWDSLQTLPETSVSGNDMFATISAPRVPWPDLFSSTVRTKEIGLQLITGLMVNMDVTALDRYASDPYYQHNPGVANGIAAAKTGFTGFFAAFPSLSTSIKRVVAEGDLVAIHYHLKLMPADPGLAVVDFFRVRNGKVIEHWDVVQPVPVSSANDNTMF